ncbi:phosphoribosyltransferase family protein [Nocardioides sp. Kera G14]|uniref:phosphoribosyltransferase family protein n=1 Tax=Nocardioides sp. Kera G14 TaxID=2884264 RepID=UPI001D118BCF|nr:phosphoribosyltransferase family protein [Nocardioides sp. Kera G14]UDY23235.1 phosphoribosyltransferase family protein [Nocardioides sp. Kera G14]
MADLVDSSLWSAEWVAERLGVRLLDHPDSELSVGELAGLAVRRNPRRAHLIVSPVLGKHVPVDPRLARETAESLGRRVVGVLEAEGVVVGTAAVIGFAETATGLGHCVADVLGAPYLHSTRRVPAGWSSLLVFEEAHSHASSHHLLPRDPAVFDGSGAIVLVDDELTSGATVANIVRALEQRSHRGLYVVAALLDLRPAASVAELDRCAAELGVRIEVVSLGRGEAELPDDVLERGQALVAGLDPPAPVASVGGVTRRVELAPVAGVARQGGRHGFDAADRAALDGAVLEWARALAELLVSGLAGARTSTSDRVPTIHVLGTEELMYLPLRLARELAELLPESTLTFSSTTRSPIAVVDDPGYAIRSRVTFTGHDGTDDAPRFAYNLGAGRFDHIVVVLDSAADTAEASAPGGLLDALASVTDDVVVAVLPPEAVL